MDYKMLKKIKIRYSIIIPVYNGSAFLSELYKRLINVMESLEAAYEVIFVDDCSSDKSWEHLERIYSESNRIKIIQLTQNFGQHSATICGISNADGRYIITLDDDLQHPPEEIPLLVREIEKGYSLVYGKYEKKKHNVYRNLGSCIVNSLIKKITDNRFNMTSFRIMKKEVADAILGMVTPGNILDILIFEVISKRDISFVTIQHFPVASSTYGIWRLIAILLNIVFNYTTAPLRIALFLGFLLSALGFVMAVIYFSFSILGYISVDGFSTLIITITIFSGGIVFILGVIGEYVGRIFLTITKRPAFVIKSKQQWSQHG